MNKPKIDKTCIYLDQFAVSEMIEAEKGSIWYDIKRSILKGHKNGILFCPLSHEHYMETSQKKMLDSVAHDNFFDKISDGYCFKPILFITSQLITSKIRNNNITAKTYFHKNVKGILQDEKNYKSFDQTSKKLNSVIEYGSSDSNEFRRNLNQQRLTPEQREFFLNTHKNLSVKKFTDRLEYLIKKNRIIIDGYSTPDGEIPHWTDLIIQQLLEKHRLTKKEMKKLIIQFKNHGFNNIPTLDIEKSIRAIMSVYNKIEKSSDQIDINRIAIGLPISDILLTDKKRKHELIELGLPEKYNTKVYSGTKDNLNDLLIELKYIEN